MTESLRALPSVNSLLSDPRVEALVDSYSRRAVVELIRSHLDDVRGAVANGGQPPTADELVAGVAERARGRWRRWPSPVINATGVILHTNLGRAPLSDDALLAVTAAAEGYSDLELDLESGRRGSRQSGIARLLAELTGGASALVVNNNASALLLGLAAVAAGKEVIVSRGEAVEIGGGFRVPDVMRQSGAELVEVGTTNRTYARDYEAAITERTGAILAVHASNFRVMGFTHSPEIEELVTLGARHGVPVLHDLGSGCLLDTAQLGLAPEPTPQRSIRAGVGLGFFSGDKLLGGPQAGIIVGEARLIDAVSRHPLARAVRADKLSMAGLAATLLHYVKGEALEKVPIWRMMARSGEELSATAHRWSQELGPRASVVPGLSTIGGGSLPGETLPSWLVSLDAGDAEGGAEALARRMRQGERPVVGRIERERVFLDPRTVLPGEEETLLRVVRQAAAPLVPSPKPG
jgi:L-seryl-tRNA(Ser) seleniumtransferase